MYSDEQIRQIILDMADIDTTAYSKSYAVIYKTNDRRFLCFALEMLHGNNDTEIEAALNTIRSAEKFYCSDYLPQILPFLDNPSHWVNAIKIIIRIGNASVFPRLIGFLAYPDLEARVTALYALFKLNYPQILEICLHLINDEDATMRSYVCHILGEMQNPLAVELLIDKLQDNEMGEKVAVNPVAAWALGLIKDKRAVEALKGAVVYGSENLSASALEALWSIEGAALEPFYLEQLKHSHEKTKREAIRLVGLLRKDDYTDLLISISQNAFSYDVQFSAAYALQAIGTPRAKEAYQYWYDFKRKS
jgi:HEAT repeat protein